MTNEMEDNESVVEEWIEEIEKMKKLKNPFAHLVVGLVETETNNMTKVQKKDCSEDDCCGNC